jgi:hypothetical protein
MASTYITPICLFLFNEFISTTILILDSQGRIIAILAGHPIDDKEWDKICRQAAQKLEEARSKLGMSSNPAGHRRGKFSTLGTGFSYGGGQTRPLNFANSENKQEVIDDLNTSRCFQRIAGFGSCRCHLSYFLLCFKQIFIQRYSKPGLQSFFRIMKKKQESSWSGILR